jgi:Mycothiol maleylpyruvate isomerase N-terminal domain
MNEAWGELSIQDGYAEAARTFVSLVRAIPADVWDGPGLGEWDLRSLVGHTSRSLITVETYLGMPADWEDVPSPEAYYSAISGIAQVNPADVAERGRAAGRALGDDPLGAVEAILERVLPLVYRDDDPLITTIVGGMRLSRYLPTRNFELVVHGTDIAAAAGLEPPGYTEQLLTQVAALAAGAAVLGGRGIELIRALTGRAALDPAFSMV